MSINENLKCPFGNTRCLCADCTSNARFKDCKKGYCIDCFECEDKGKAVHDVYLCTGHESRKDLNKITACPWCGETDKRAIIRRGLDGRYFIHHMDAVFNIKSSCGFDTEAEAVAAWEKMGAKDGETEKLH